MLRTAGQTAGPYGRKFFVDTHGWPGGVIDSTKKFLRATPGAQLDIWLEGG